MPIRAPRRSVSEPAQVPGVLFGQLTRTPALPPFTVTVWARSPTPLKGSGFVLKPSSRPKVAPAAFAATRRKWYLRSGTRPVTGSATGTIAFPAGSERVVVVLP